MPESLLLPTNYIAMAEAEPDLSTFENKTGLAEDMKFLASMPELCDVTFLVGDTREPVCAVKAVLAARSRVFHKMLYQTPSPQRKKEPPPRENKLRLFLKRSSEPLLNLQNASQQPPSQQHQTLIIEEFEPDVFRQLIEYIHTGCVTLQPRTLLGVMNAADYYGLDELRRACAGFVQCCINVDTVCALLASAERYIQYKCTKNLVQKVLEFVDEHGNEVLNLGSFTLLPQHVVRLILARDELQADEFTKFQAALMWGKKYCDSNPSTSIKDVIGNFLEYIQFHKIPANVLMREIHPLGLVPYSIIMNALAYQADPASVDPGKLSPNRVRRQAQGRSMSVQSSLDPYGSNTTLSSSGSSELASSDVRSYVRKTHKNRNTTIMIESVSKRAFSGSSGTYNVHALELAAARVRKLKGLNVTVRFLDDTEHVFHVEKRANGAALLEQVYQHLELVEKDYFGLQYSENGCTPGNKQPELMRWLDPSKLIKKQLNSNYQYPLYFRVKFYVSDPSKLQEEYTRYQFYLQIRRDILEGRLHLPVSTAILLASYTVQSELGDYNPEEHGPNYLSNMQLIIGQTDDIEKKISELHKLHKGQLPADAEFNFLDHAKRIDMYGVELHKAKDNTNRDIELGVTHIGLVVFQNNLKINTFSWSKIMKISFKRKQFFILLRREPSENYDTCLGFNMETYRSSKTLWKACVEHHTFFRLHSPHVKRKFPFSLGSKFTYSGRTEFQTVSDVRKRGKLERKFVRSPSKQLIRQSITAPQLEEKGKSLLAPGRPPRPYDNKVTVLDTKEPKQAWTEDSHISDDDGGFLERTLEGPFSPGIAGRVLSYADEEEPSPTSNNGLYDTPPYSVSHSPTSQIVEDGLITIILHPDEDGKYGFNVKGGTEQSVPILVSRVAPNTPADKCTPRLTEGDQLMQINGHDVQNALHHDVVQLIQEARKINSGKLVLVVKPNVLYQSLDELDVEEEPPYQYVPALAGENNIIQSTSTSAIVDLLQQSMLLLADGLASGALIAQYELLYHKHPDLTCDESSKPKNVNKNRYRDISPYDTTRVILKNGPTGDYINANYVNMFITKADKTNRYIATQGPLQSTTEDFWQMILEDECNLIVMLTTLIERGRAKCHKYWPNLNDELVLQNISVKCVSEENDPSNSFVFRDFILTDLKLKTERKIKHMQYTAWPDHGVPDSPNQFLIFTEKIRELRGEDGGEAPVVVHCSAGIGRTGVLVLMETALDLIEAGEAVYPLEIVKTMREQRAMMIQNASQYRFVCESVYAAYTQKIVQQT